MILKQYIVTPSAQVFTINQINEEIGETNQIIMLSGYPNGRAAEKCLVIYALYDNGMAHLMEKKCPRSDTS